MRVWVCIFLCSEGIAATTPVLASIGPPTLVSASSSAPELRILWLLAKVLGTFEYRTLSARVRLRLLRILIERALDTALIRCGRRPTVLSVWSHLGVSMCVCSNVLFVCSHTRA